MPASDIETQLQKLKSEMAELAKTVAAVGADAAGGYRAKAGTMATDAIDASHTLLDGVRGEFEALEKDVVARIRTQPLRALGLALGVGFLIAFVARR